jgi:lipopolysaccharide export LptBFGC system permease protein LptF
MSPFAAMWMANALLLAVGLLLARRPRGTDRSAIRAP